MPGVKGLKDRHSLAQMDASPLKEALNRAFITADVETVRNADGRTNCLAYGGTNADAHTNISRAIRQPLDAGTGHSRREAGRQLLDKAVPLPYHAKT